MKQQIGYRPNIQYQDEYTSDASNVFDKDKITPELDDNSIIEDLIEQGDIIDSLIGKLPNDTSGAISEIVDQIIQFIEEELKDKEYERIPEEWEWKYDDTVVDEDTDLEAPDENDKFDEEDFWEDVDEFPIIKEEHTKLEIIEKEYIKNSVDLFDDYFTNLHTILSTLWTGLVLAVINKPTSEINIVLNNILLTSSEIKDDSKHLLDSAIRTQLLKDIKFNYFKNIFNAEETITHLRQFKSMYELRKRYAVIEQASATNNANQMNNNILDGVQAMYSKKYDIAYENLYRYLKSSNKVLEDTFQTWVSEIKSKQTLLERKGIK